MTTTDREVRFVRLSDLPPPGPPPTRWGAWRLSGHELVTKAGGYPYKVDLLTCTSSAEVLDWICQIAGKTWGTPHVIGNLVRAFDALLDPQASLCSWGLDRRLTTEQIERLIIGYRDRRRAA